MNDQNDIERVDAIYRDGQHYDCLFDSSSRDYWLGIAERYGGPILELGCGTGNITIPLAEAGFEAAGLDNAQEMLAYADIKSKQAGVDVRFVHANMMDFAIDERFALIMLPSNNIGHLHDPREVNACLTTARKHLAPGGHLAIDVFVPSVSLLSKGPDAHEVLAEYEAPDGSGPCELSAVSIYEPDTQIKRSRTRHKIPGRPDVMGTLDVKMYYPQELDLLLMHNGFQIVEKYGGYDRSSFGPESRKQLVIAQATEN